MTLISGLSNNSREPIKPVGRSTMLSGQSMDLPLNFDALATSNLSESVQPLVSPEEGSLETSSLAADDGQPKELKQAFNDFVGQTFFGQLIASLRSTQGESAYFNGGQAEKIFQGQFDQQLAEYMSEASADQIADPMFKLFSMRQR